MLAADEHENAIAHSLQITNAVAADRLTITSASIVGMSAAWKIGGAGKPFPLNYLPYLFEKSAVVVEFI